MLMTLTHCLEHSTGRRLKKASGIQYKSVLNYKQSNGNRSNGEHIHGRFRWTISGKPIDWINLDLKSPHPSRLFQSIRVGIDPANKYTHTHTLWRFVIHPQDSGGDLAHTHTHTYTRDRFSVWIRPARTFRSFTLASVRAAYIRGISDVRQTISRSGLRLVWLFKCGLLLSASTCTVLWVQLPEHNRSSFLSDSDFIRNHWEQTVPNVAFFFSCTAISEHKKQPSVCLQSKLTQIMLDKAFFIPCILTESILQYWNETRHSADFVSF